MIQAIDSPFAKRETGLMFGAPEYAPLAIFLTFDVALEVQEGDERVDQPGTHRIDGFQVR